MNDILESKIRGMVIEQDWIQRRRLIQEMSVEWEKSRECDFQVYVAINFPIFWIEKVRRN